MLATDNQNALDIMIMIVHLLHPLIVHNLAYDYYRLECPWALTWDTMITDTSYHSNITFNAYFWESLRCRGELSGGGGGAE